MEANHFFLYLSYGLVASLVVALVYVSWRIRLRMLHTVLVSIGRMAGQLLLVGLYMKWLFLCNSIWVNLLWVVLMAVVATVSVCRQARLRFGRMWLPVTVGLVATTVGVGLYVLFLLFRPAAMLDARYAVPVWGVLLGCMQQVVGVALGEYYRSLRHNGQLYDYLLGNGATHLEAVMPFVRQAVEKALQPLLASLSVAGILSVPGLLLGQLMGGVMPVDAAVNVVVITLASVFASVVSVLLTLYLADRRSFDSYGRLRQVWTKR